MLQKLQQLLGEDRVKANLNLSPYATFKLAGSAEFYFDARSEEDMVKAVRAALDLNIPYIILGGISNVIVSEKGIKGLVIKNTCMNKKVLEDNSDNVLLEVSSGYNMTRLAKETAKDGYEGFEYQAGLPGTLGGAMYMNSKWTAHQPTRYVGDQLEAARLVNNKGEIRTENRDYFQFACDYSILHETKEIVLSATFRMPKNDPDKLLARCEDALEYRKQTQPYGVASSGCFFQNVNGVSAGRLIDEAGLKGYTIGGATISDRHANFIINNGNATESDVRALVEHIKKTVYEKHGVQLEEEIIII